MNISLKSSFKSIVIALYVGLFTTNLAVAQTFGNGNNPPGGSTTQLQYNNAGTFGGITGATTNGSTLVLTTPDIGVATATSINGNTITAGTGILTLGAGKTFTNSNTLTLTATDGSTLAIGTGGTLGSNAYTSTAYLPLSGGTLSGAFLVTNAASLGTTLTNTGTADGTTALYVQNTGNNAGTGYGAVFTATGSAVSSNRAISCTASGSDGANYCYYGSAGRLLNVDDIQTNGVFNVNGTDGITTTCTVIPTGLTFVGGILVDLVGGTCS